MRRRASARMGRMSEEKKPNWVLAIFTTALLIGALIALAIPILRMVAGLILLGCWAVFSSSASYSWFGGRTADVWMRVALALIVLVFAAIALPASARIFLVLFAAAEVLLAWWSIRRLKADRSANP